MEAVRIKGDRNIANIGVIQGDCIIDSTIIHLSESSLLDLLKTFSMDNSEKEQSLVNMTDAQKKLADAIDKFAQAELIRAEADKLRAKADENNSEANLNYSKIMLEDRALIKQMIDKYAIGIYGKDGVHFGFVEKDQKYFCNKIEEKGGMVNGIIEVHKRKTGKNPFHGTVTIDKKLLL